MKPSGCVILAFMLSTLALSRIQAQSPVVEWTKTLHGNGAWSVHQTADSGYFLNGSIWYGAGNNDMHLIKTDKTGDTAWTTSFEGGQYGVASYGRSGRQSFDGGYIAVGFKAGEFYVVKTGPSGGSLWTKTYGGGYTNIATCVRQTRDSCYIVSGFADVWGKGDEAFLINLTKNGDTVFLYHYGGPQWERANAVIQTPDDGFIAVGSIRPVGTTDYYDQLWILKTDAAGNEKWVKVYGGPNVDVATGVLCTGDGGYLVGGYTNTYGAGDYDFYLMKLNSSGDSVWAKTYGSTLPERSNSMVQTGDGNFVLAGRGNVGASPAIFAVKVNADGDTLWTKHILGEGGMITMGYAVDATVDGGCIIAGSIGTFDANTYLVKLTSGATAVRSDPWNMVPQETRLHQNYPNPFNPVTQIRYTIAESKEIKLVVYDLLGRDVAVLVNERKAPGTYEVKSDGSGLASGVYLYRLTAGKYVESRKMVLVR